MEAKQFKIPAVKDGDTFSIGGMEFIKFPATAEGVPVVMKDAAFSSRFGKNNDFRRSVVLKRLQEEVLPKIEEAIGADRIQEFSTDLTSWDGLKDYGDVRSKISIPTMDFYRQNVEIFDKYKKDTWWLLATAFSTPTHDDAWWALCVSPSGRLNFDYCISGLNGVRPFLILNPSIFES